jgi:hypothetical protein
MFILLMELGTPIGAYLGQYKKIESVDLGVSCVKGLLRSKS